MTTTCDVVVVGGGPAGAAAASRLAMLGYRIVLVAGGPSRRARLLHHLPPTIGPLLAAIGAPNAVGEAGGVPVPCRRVRWGTSLPIVVEDRPPGALVDRAAFDAILVEAAWERGAIIREGHTVERARHRATGGWDLWLSTDVGGREIRARYLVDASGGRLALGERRARWAPSTTALHGRWPIAGDMSEVVTAAHGWLWVASSLAVGGGQALVVLFADSRSLVGLSSRDRSLRYAEVVRRSLELGDVDPSSLGSCDATPMWSPQPVGSDLVRVGDAALSLDPLSSDGVRNALQSALHGAAALHTMVTRPQDGHIAARFLEGATVRALRHNHRITANHYATGGRSDFFSARTEPPTGRRTDAASAGTRSPLQPDDVLEWSAAAHFQHVPALLGDIIQVRPALHHPSLDDPIVMLGNRPASDLRAAIDGRATAATAIGMLRAVGWGDHAASVLATLHALGVLQTVRASAGRYCGARASA